MKRPCNYLLIALLFMVSFIVRLLPTMESGLPFNIDGFPLAKISEIMISSGHIPNYGAYSGLLGYNMKLPVFPLLLSQFSIVLGVEPLVLLPYFCAFIGSFSVVIVYIFALKILKNQRAALLASLFLAFTGLFVYVTTAAMKELLGIVVLCLLLYSYSLRKDPRHRMIAVALLVLLPFIHHLTSLIAFIIVSLVSFHSILVANKHEEKFFRHVVLELLAGPALGLIALAYYLSVEMQFFSDVSNLNDSALLFSVCTLGLLVHVMISSPAMSKPWFFLPVRDKKGNLSIFALFDEKVLFVMIAMFILYINGKKSLFIGAPKTTGLLLDLMVPYFILAIIGMVGFNLLRYSKFKYKPVIIAMFLAPLILMAFSVFRGLDVFNFTLVFRAYNFIDIPLAIVSGMGAAYLIKLALDYTKDHGKALKIVPVSIFLAFCLLCVASIPLAYERVEAFGIQETTYDYEFEAMAWLADSNVTTISSDQRYMDIIGPYFNVTCDWTMPWILARGQTPEDTTILISDSWTDIGAQMNIMERVVISDERMDMLINRSSRIYCGGPEGNNMYVLKTG
ncbi:MAG: hypothetical protein KAS67_03395 [Thermoplasmata archaeon]|nr:hypothetical protein [Thermoplasmata archaeon]